MVMVSLESWLRNQGCFGLVDRKLEVGSLELWLMRQGCFGLVGRNWVVELELWLPSQGCCCQDKSRENLALMLELLKDFHH